MDFSKFDKAVDTEQLQKQIEEAKNNPQQTNKSVPAGTYMARLEKLEVGATKDGRPMLKAMFRIIEGEFKKWCLFLNRVIYGTKNDANMIASAVGWINTLGADSEIEFKNYSQFAAEVLDVFEEVADYTDYEVFYDPDEFNSISVSGVFDASDVPF